MLYVCIMLRALAQSTDRPTGRIQMSSSHKLFEKFKGRKGLGEGDEQIREMMRWWRNSFFLPPSLFLSRFFDRIMDVWLTAAVDLQRP